MGWKLGLGKALVPRTAAAFAALAILTTLARFQPTESERYVVAMPPGGADFAQPYLGSVAWLNGTNPYEIPAGPWSDPWHRVIRGSGGRGFTNGYPPSHYLLHAPLALFWGRNWVGAARVWFFVLLLALVGLSLLVPLLAGRPGPSPGLRMLVFTLLALSPATQLALERGQSDLVISLLLWAGVAAITAGHWAKGMAFVVASTLLKPYAIVAATGLFLAAIRAGRTRQALLGGCLTTVALVGPVAHLVPDGIAASLGRANEFVRVESSHSFRYLASFMTDLHDVGLGIALKAAAGLLVLLCFTRVWARVKPAANDRPDGMLGGAAPSVHAFVLAAVVAVIGSSDLSYAYNLCIILPGAVAMALAAGGAIEDRASFARDDLIRWGLASAACACLIFRRTPTGEFPLASIGLLLSAITCALVSKTQSRPMSVPP
jgi:hypothetical protein